MKFVIIPAGGGEKAGWKALVALLSGLLGRKSDEIHRGRMTKWQDSVEEKGKKEELRGEKLKGKKTVQRTENGERTVKKLKRPEQKVGEAWRGMAEYGKWQSGSLHQRTSV